MYFELTVPRLTATAMRYRNGFTLLILVTPFLVAGCRSIAATGLEALRLELPCKGEKIVDGTECHWDPSYLQSADPQWQLKRELVRRFGGRQGMLYDVTLRVRGVVEPKNFIGGTVREQHFQSGGTVLVDHYNIYSISVSDPAQTYTVNRHQDKVSNFTFPIDYQVTIPIRGGATVTIGEYDSNDVAIANHKQFVIPGIRPAPEAFDGQFFQIDVVEVRVQP